MAHAPTPIRSIAALSILVMALGSGAERPGEPARTVEQQTLIDFAVDRFTTQGLEPPNVEIVFHDSLIPCQGHKGLYWLESHTLEMCSLDNATMLHELAHAWANDTLSVEEMEIFVAWRGLDSWNNHDSVWEQRGTEHVAETIAWALLDDPSHVKWVETHANGSETISYLILTLDVDVEILLENFKWITGQDPVFRHAGEWSTNNDASESSPESAKLGL